VPAATPHRRRLAVALTLAAPLLLLCREPAAAAHKSFAGVPSPVTDESEPRVLSVVSQRPGAPDRVGLNDRLTLTVRQLSQLLDEVNGNCAGLTLFLGGMPLKGLTPESCDLQADQGEVRYLLVRTDQADAVWHALLGSPGDFERQVSVSVGVSESLAIPSDVASFRLVILPRLELYLFFAVVAGGVVFLFYLSRRTDILRNPSTQPGPDGKFCYSLARFQLGFWFVLTVAAYLFLWMITGELDTITESVLALIGIGSGTALGASLIDAGKDPRPNEGGPGEASQRRGSGSFLTDVLSDGAGMSLHRFQMFVWTLVLGVIFCFSVYRRLAMPDFSVTLLGLMGISSGTYLGFKFPEKETPKPPIDPAAPPP
jgi:hypothetical protein